MRQYNPVRQVIAAASFVAIACLLPGNHLQAETGGNSLAELQRTVNEQFAAQGQPAVRPFQLHVQDNKATAVLELVAGYDKSMADFVFAVPAAEITSATVKLVDEGSTVEAGISTIARPVSLGYVRRNRLARIQFSTSIFQQAKGSAQAVLMLEFDQPVSTGMAGRGEPGLVDMTLRELVANPDDLPRLAMPLASVPGPADHDAPPLGNGTTGAVAFFDVEADGVVEFSGDDLTSAGVDIENLLRQNVSVWSNGLAQSVWAVPVDGSISEPVQQKDRFRVYVRDNRSTYTTTQRYWIRTDVQAQPMARRSLTAATVMEPADAWFRTSEIVEEDIPPVLTKNDQFLSILEHRWVWWTWTGKGEGTNLPSPRDYGTPGEISFDLPELAQAAVETSITLDFYAHEWPAETVPVAFEVMLNGVSVGEAVVRSADGLREAISVPSTSLRTHNNKLEIWPVAKASPSSMPDICFDQMTISYPRKLTLTSSTLEFTEPAGTGNAATLNANAGDFVLDISDDQPTILAVKENGNGVLTVPVPRDSQRFLAVNASAVSPSGIKPYKLSDDLVASTNSADLVVIAWPEFIDALEPWVEAIKADGYAVRVVDVHDIYDQFGYGHLSPHAIRAFLRHAAIHWQPGSHGPAVSNVMLVGDSTSAYRNEFRNDVINYVPTMRMAGLTDVFASDQWYACIFGDDPYADAFIGRFSVNSVDDLRKTLQKQLDYRRQKSAAAWQNTLGFVADHSEFEDAVNRVTKQAVPPRFFVDRVMMSELPWVDNFYFPKEIADEQQAKVSTEATRRIRDMFNNGAAVVTYFGHGSPNVWSSERMWFGGGSPNSDNLLLSNRDRLAVVINMTCNSGAIDYPQPSWNVCISEDFMRVENGGAVACFVPSGPGLTVQHERLMMEIGPTLFSGTPRPMGESLQLALWRYLAKQNPPDLAQMYILLGDPLLVPQIALAAEPDGDAAVAQNAGFIVLPPGPEEAVRHGQVKTFDGGLDSSEIRELGANARLFRPAAEDLELGGIVAISTASADQTSTLAQSFFLPADGLKSARVTRWRRLDDPAVDDGLATLEFTMTNEMPVPLRGVSISAEHQACADCDSVESEAVTIPAMGSTTCVVDVQLEPGLNRYTLALVSGGVKLDVDVDPPVTLAGIRHDGDTGTNLPPAVMDPESLQVRYRQGSDNTIRAQITFRLHVLSRIGIADMSIALVRPDGTLIADSAVAVPGARPGSSTNVSMSVDLPADQTSATYMLQFDPKGLHPEFRRFPAPRVALGSDHFPDVTIASITSPDQSPVDGETIYFDVTLANVGESPVDGVQVSGERISPDGTAEALESQVKIRQPLISLPPHTSATTRLRWDPFKNAGENVIRFTASSSYQAPDRNADNNVVEFTLPVRSKARIQKGRIQVLPLTAEERRQRQIRIGAEIRNTGESAAQGLQVRFYASPEMKGEDLLGTADIDRIAPGETHQAILTYHLKPGEENRQFRMSYEVLYRGARQRVPLDTGD